MLSVAVVRTVVVRVRFAAQTVTVTTLVPPFEAANFLALNPHIELGTVLSTGPKSVQVPEQLRTMATQSAFSSQAARHVPPVHLAATRLRMAEVELVDEMTLPTNVVLHRML